MWCYGGGSAHSQILTIEKIQIRPGQDVQVNEVFTFVI